MAKILNLLFDEYTQNLDMSAWEAQSQRVQDRYQQLRMLAGDEAARDIWDAAVGVGATMQDIYFQAGFKTGMALMLELFAL